MGLEHVLHWIGAGYSSWVVANRDWWMRRVSQVEKEDRDMSLTQKEFKPKFPKIPRVKCYKVIKD